MLVCLLLRESRIFLLFVLSRQSIFPKKKKEGPIIVGTRIVAEIARTFVYTTMEHRLQILGVYTG